MKKRSYFNVFVLIKELETTEQIFKHCSFKLFHLTVFRHNQPFTRSSATVAFRVKSCYIPLRLGTVSSGIDFVNTSRLYSDRATR